MGYIGIYYEGILILQNKAHQNPSCQGKLVLPYMQNGYYSLALKDLNQT